MTPAQRELLEAAEALLFGASPMPGGDGCHVSADALERLERATAAIDNDPDALVADLAVSVHRAERRNDG